MSREGGGRIKSQSTKETISPQKSITGEKALHRPAETFAGSTGDATSNVTQQIAHALSSASLQRREEREDESTRHVIAVSASKGPAAFFNLARKFLATDEICDLSALEGAIVSAVDAAHLLERSKLATIERIQTSYVAVEPKRRKSPTAHISTTSTESGAQITQEPLKSIPTASTETVTSSSTTGVEGHMQSSHLTAPSAALKAASFPMTRSKKSKGGATSEVRRARIMITVKRTPEYRQWLQDNPIPDTSTGEDEDPNVNIQGTSLHPTP